jgi:hypothetical protein
MLDWMSRIYHGLFGSTETNSHSGDISKCPFMNPGLVKAEPEPVKEVVENSTPTFPELYSALMKFKPANDVLVLSQEYIDEVDRDPIENRWYKQKLADLGNKVIVIPKGFLVPNNVAIVTAGYYGR